jgi:hypothetical protein
MKSHLFFLAATVAALLIFPATSAQELGLQPPCARAPGVRRTRASRRGPKGPVVSRTPFRHTTRYIRSRGKRRCRDHPSARRCLLDAALPGGC